MTRACGEDDDYLWAAARGLLSQASLEEGGWSCGFFPRGKAGEGSGGPPFAGRL